MGIALLDSNAIVGFLDADDPLHGPADAAVKSIATEHAFVVSVVTVAELLTGAKLGHHDEATVRRFGRTPSADGGQRYGGVAASSGAVSGQRAVSSPRDAAAKARAADRSGRTRPHHQRAHRLGRSVPGGRSGRSTS